MLKIGKGIILWQKRKDTSAQLCADHTRLKGDAEQGLVTSLPEKKLCPMKKGD